MPGSKINVKSIEDPWLRFLRAVDETLNQRTEIHCIGGFALLLLLDETQPTGDVDFIGVVPSGTGVDLERIAGRDSRLAADHKLYLQEVSVTEPPCDYRDRLVPATPVGFEKLEIKILEPYDLVLTKLDRNSPRDREDVRSLISELELDGDILRERFEQELKPYLAVGAERTILTFELWMEEFFPSL